MGPASTGGYNRQSRTSSHPADNLSQTYAPHPADNHSQTYNQYPADSLGQTYAPHPADNHGQTHNQYDSLGQAYNQYPADSLGQSFDPYANNRTSYQNVNPRLSNSSGRPGFSLASGSGLGRTFFGHGQGDTMGSNEPLLGAASGRDSSPEPALPAVPPRNPLRLLGYGGGGGQDDGNDEDAPPEYEPLRSQSLRVRSPVCDPMHPSDCLLLSILGSKQPRLVSMKWDLLVGCMPNRFL